MCGRVQYEIQGPPQVSYYCHCDKCRKQSGSAFATNLIVAKEHLVFVKGEDSISSWVSSPGKRRYFCSGCGSPLYSHGQSTARVVSVRAGTLNDPLPVLPSVHAFVAHKAAWWDIRDNLPQHPEYFA